MRIIMNPGDPTHFGGHFFKRDDRHRTRRLLRFGVEQWIESKNGRRQKDATFASRIECNFDSQFFSYRKSTLAGIYLVVSHTSVDGPVWAALRGCPSCGMAFRFREEGRPRRAAHTGPSTEA